ncbi:MAG: hypothetical protein MJE63_24710 [Proteobacteria bacterium]|nr:hypothetical protein [Pseudomonadota bacterium]
MRPLYSFKGLKLDVILSQQYDVPKMTKYGIFPVPIDNAIGVNTLENSLAVLYFEGNQLELRKIKTGVSGGDCKFLPVFSKDWVAWGQTRFLIMHNLQTGEEKYIETFIKRGNFDYIHSLAVIDGEKHRFLVVMDSHSNKENKVKYYAKQYNMKDETSEESTSFYLSEKGNRQRVFLGMINDRILVNNHSIGRYELLDLGYSTEPHYLTEFLNSNKDIDDYSFLIFKNHPYLNFAVVGGKTKLWLVSWENDRLSSYPIIYLPKTDLRFDISSDGKWLIVHFLEKFVDRGPETYKLYAMRINPELPHYIDHPIELQSHHEEFGDRYVWTTNPTSFNVVSFDKLIHWVIEPN